MRRVILAALVAVACPVAAQNAAPFCLVNQFGGANCFYYNLDACRMAQSTLGGICTANPNAMQQQNRVQPPSYPAQPQKNFAETFAESYERGARIRRERELHQARMRALEAQTEAAQRQSRSLDAPSSSGNILYKCPSDDGAPIYTTSPKVGCEVAGSL